MCPLDFFFLNKQFQNSASANGPSQKKGILMLIALQKRPDASAIRWGIKIEGGKVHVYVSALAIGQNYFGGKKSAYSVSAKIHYDAKKTFFVNRESTLMPRK